MDFGYYILNTYIPELDGTGSDLYGRYREQIQAAEAAGFDTVWATEHHFRSFGGMTPNPQMLLAVAQIQVGFSTPGECNAPIVRGVVVMLTVKGACVLASIFSVAGTVHVAPVGAPVQLKEAAPVIPAPPIASM